MFFIVNEVKNFATNNIVQVAGVSHRLEIYASKEKRLLQDQVQLDIGVKI